MATRRSSTSVVVARRAAPGALLIAIAAAAAIGASPRYEIIRLGFHDAQHTRADGYQESSASGLADAGSVAGVSTRYNPPGTTAWAYDPGTGALTRIGLFDAQHTRADEYQESRPYIPTDGGRVVGYSVRFDPPGQTTWAYDPGTGAVTRIGLFDAEHTRPDGYQYSDVVAGPVSNWTAPIPGPERHLGVAAGVSRRFGPNAEDLGTSAWFYEPTTGTTRLIGLTGPEFTAPDGTRRVEPRCINSVGQCLGRTLIPGTTNRYATWFYDPATDQTTRIALPSETNSWPTAMSSSFTVGCATITLESRSAIPGTAAWIYDHATGITTGVGPIGPQYIGPNGTDIQAVHVTNLGRVVGKATVFDASGAEVRTNVWLYDAPLTELRMIVSGQTTLPGPISATGRYVCFTDVLIWRFCLDYVPFYIPFIYDWTNGNSTRIEEGETFYEGGDFMDCYWGQDVEPWSFNALDQVKGGSLDFTYFPGWGSYWPWVYDPATGMARSFGLTDWPAHRDSMGCCFSSMSLADNGWAMGNSVRFIGPWIDPFDHPRTTAWIHDPDADQVTALDLSIDPITGEADSKVVAICDTGVLFGSYILYAPDGSSTENGFRWTRDDGAVDIDTLIHGGLAGAGLTPVPNEFPVPQGDPNGGMIRSACAGEYVLGHASPIGHPDSVAFFLLIPAPSCEADLDRNGPVDVADFGILAANFGARNLPPFTGGDLDGDRDVDIFDFAEFAVGFDCTQQ